MKNLYFYSFIITFAFTLLIFLEFGSFRMGRYLLLTFILIYLALCLNKSSRFFSNLFLIILVAVLLAWFRIEILPPANVSIEEYVDTKVSLEGIIVDEPDQRIDKTNYIVEIEPGLRIKISTLLLPRFQYGDHISIYGTLKKPQNFANENNIEFDYISFLSKDDIYYLMYYPKVDVLESSHRKDFKFYVLKIKRWLSDRISKRLESPKSELANGLLLGVKEGLGKDILEKFRVVGLIHIVVLSGYNLTIIVVAIKKMLGFLPRNLNLILSALAVVSFAIMTGLSATIMRASLMVLLVILAEFLRREYQVNRSMFLALFVMVLQNPFVLSSDPGFQLSFVATFGLINLTPYIEKLFGFLSERFEIRQIVASTISTQISVLPLLINMTGEISIVSLVVNLIVLPVVPLTMLFSFLLSLVDFWPLVLITDFLLSYIFFITNIFASFSFSVYRF